MNHLTDEQWMDYLYAEATPKQRAEMEVHLNGCPQCQNQLRQYRGTQATLNTWDLPPQPSTPSPAKTSSLLWTAKAAALFILSTSCILLGRALPPSQATLQQLKSEITQDLQRDMLTTLQTHVQPTLAQLATDIRNTRSQLHHVINATAAARTHDQQTWAAQLTDLEQRRTTDYTTLRHDLETVAVQANYQLERTQQRLGQLVSLTQPLSYPKD